MTLAGLYREESREVEFVGWQTTGGQRCDHGAWARHWFHPDSGVYRIGHHPCPGIRDTWTSGISDQGHRFAAAQSFEDFNGAPGFVEPEVGDEWFTKVEVLEELAGAACILGCHQVALPQHPEGAQGDVFEIPDRGRDEVQGSWNQRGRGGGIHGWDVIRPGAPGGAESGT